MFDNFFPFFRYCFTIFSEVFFSIFFFFFSFSTKHSYIFLHYYEYCIIEFYYFNSVIIKDYREKDFVCFFFIENNYISHCCVDPVLVSLQMDLSLRSFVVAVVIVYVNDFDSIVGLRRLVIGR